MNVSDKTITFPIQRDRNSADDSAQDSSGDCVVTDVIEDTSTPTEFILLEDGSFLLLEDGDKIGMQA